MHLNKLIFLFIANICRLLSGSIYAMYTQYDVNIQMLLFVTSIPGPKELCFFINYTIPLPQPLMKYSLCILSLIFIILREKSSQRTLHIIMIRKMELPVSYKTMKYFFCFIYAWTE